MKIIFDTEELTRKLPSLTDEYLCACWHISQANPCDIKEKDAGDFAEQVGREIIRRFILKTGPALWNHQGKHCELIKNIDSVRGNSRIAQDEEETRS